MGCGGMNIWYSPKGTSNVSVTVTWYSAKSCAVSVPPETNAPAVSEHGKNPPRNRHLSWALDLLACDWMKDRKWRDWDSTCLLHVSE